MNIDTALSSLFHCDDQWFTSCVRALSSLPAIYSYLPTYLLFLKLARTSHTHTHTHTPPYSVGPPTPFPPSSPREESGSVHETSKSSSHTHTAITICSVQDIELQSCVGPGQDVKLQPQPVLGRTLNCSRIVSPGEDAKS